MGKLARRQVPGDTTLRVIITVVLILCACRPVLAAEVVPWLYEVVVPVDSQTAAERSRAASFGLLQVLSRVSGLAYVPRTDAVNEALKRSDTYYNEFRFANDEEGNLNLVIQFDAAPVLELVRRSDLPIWRASREKVLAWVVVADERGRAIVGATSDSPLAAGLLSRARERGIPLALPLLDLQDQLNVDPAAVWGRLSQVLDPASARYGAEVLLLGRVTTDEAGNPGSDWEFWLDGVVVPFAGEGEDLTAQATHAIDVLADELAARRAVLGREAGAVRMAVAGIRNPTDYASLLRYLSSLEFVDSVRVAELVDERLVLVVNTPAAPGELLETFERDGRMFDDQLAVRTGADLRLLWRRDD